ncbi:MAG: peptidylprolyl isomerase [Candidatus Hydrogenedentes bacterium]|nr:peptidylprolyl isomerase [Candidatus Hydrogenedentota bacterium]
MKKLVIILVLMTGLFFVSAVSLFRVQKSIEADQAAAAEARKRVAAIMSSAASSAAERGVENVSPIDETPPAKYPFAESIASVEIPHDLPPSLTVIPIESAPEKTPEQFTALFKTTKGYFAVEFHRDWAPHGVDRMYELVRNQFFNDMRVFRMLPGFVAQFGISGDPLVSAKWKDANFPDDPVKQSNIEGTFVFGSRSQPNSRNTQVFINLADNTPELETRGYAPVGKVIFGMDVVKSFHSSYADETDAVQHEIQSKGNAFLDEHCPKLDRIIQTHLIATVADPSSVDLHLRALAGDTRIEDHSAVAEIAPDKFTVRFECSMGSFAVECIRSWAPIGVDRFYALVKSGFFNDSKFYRVLPDYIVQFGLPAVPSQHASWVNSRIADDNSHSSNTESTVAFAQPLNMINARSTQIYINLNDNSQIIDPLSMKPFGRVIEGMETVKKINAVYGEFPDQHRIWKEGNAYLEPYFPGLDTIISASIVDGAAPFAAPAESAPAR